MSLYTKYDPIITNTHVQTLMSWWLRKAKTRNHKHIGIDEIRLSDGDVLYSEVDKKMDHPDFGVILIHGLGGCCRSTNILNMSRNLGKHFSLVVRPNLRNAGPYRTKSDGLYHSGRDQDVTDLIKYYGDKFPETKFVVVAVSLGGLLLIKSLAKSTHSRVIKTYAICPPSDLKKSADKLNTSLGGFYERHLLKYLRKEASVFCEMKEINFDKRDFKKIKSIKELDEKFTCTISGYSRADEYYIGESLTPELMNSIKTPLDIISAIDDPIVHFELDIKNPIVNLITSERGGHVGYVTKKLSFWYENYIEQDFLKSDLFR